MDGSLGSDEVAVAISRLELIEERVGTVTPIAAIVDINSVVDGDTSWVRVGAMPGGGSMAV